MKIARVFLEVDMRQSFQGLTDLLMKNKINTKTLGKGDFIVFLNKRGSAFKVLAGNSYLTYFNNQGRPFPIEALQYLPEFFGGDSFDFTAAVEKTVRGKFMKKVGHVAEARA